MKVSFKIKFFQLTVEKKKYIIYISSEIVKNSTNMENIIYNKYYRYCPFSHPKQ